VGNTRAPRIVQPSGPRDLTSINVRRDSVRRDTTKGPGRTIEPAVRLPLERAFGESFANVRDAAGNYVAVAGVQSRPRAAAAAP
jgi:hypothetical protein